LLTGVFASLVVNPAGAAGGIAQFGRQAGAVGVTLSFSFAATWVILKVTDLLVGLRASEDDEEVGLDLSQHGEAAYAWTERAATPVGSAADGTYVIRDGEREIEIPEVILLETARRVLELSRAGNGEVARTGSE
jgi:Ammonium Transporter Family